MVTFSRNHLIRDAIGEALYDSMKLDPSIVLMGEGAQVKMHYDAPKVLDDFPERVVTMPISEDGSTNFAIGAALLGVKPICDIIGADFLYRAMDSICNTAAKLDYVTREKHTIVVRSEFLTGGPTTGQRPEALFAHIPGLRVAIPSTPRDAYALMHMALISSGVTLFFEDRMIDDAGEWDEDDLKLGGLCPFGTAWWAHKGQRGNVTILSYGVMVQTVKRVLRGYKFDGDCYGDDYPMLCDLIDLRSIYPIDWLFIEKMLERTQKLLVIEPDVQYGGVGAEIVAHIAETMPHVKVRRLGGPRETIPAAMSRYAGIMPREEEIASAIRAFNSD